MKTNLTPQEVGKLLDQSTRGKVFEDGPYQYRIFVAYTPMGHNSAGMIITVTNTPEAISGDLITYALSRVAIILRNFKEPFEILPSKIWVDSFGHDINFISLINKGNAKGQFIDLRNAKEAQNLYGTFSMREFVENNNKVLNKLNKFIERFVSKHPVFELPAVPDDLDRKDKTLFNQQIIPLIRKVHSIKESKFKLPPVKFNITSANGESKVNYVNSDEDDPLKVKYRAHFNISADKTNPLVKTFDTVANAGYGHEDRAAADAARVVITKHNNKIINAIEKYFETYCPVECGVSFSMHYGQNSTGSGPRD